MTYQIFKKHFKGDVYAKNSEFEVDGKKYFGAKFVVKISLSNL